MQLKGRFWLVLIDTPQCVIRKKYSNIQPYDIELSMLLNTECVTLKGSCMKITLKLWSHVFRAETIGRLVARQKINCQLFSTFNLSSVIYQAQTPNCLFIQLLKCYVLLLFSVFISPFNRLFLNFWLLVRQIRSLEDVTLGFGRLWRTFLTISWLFRDYK